MQFPDPAPEAPIELFRQWYAEAKSSEPNDPDAMALASADASGQPDVRMVLLKHFDQDGFVFYTNFESAKGHATRRESRRRRSASIGNLCAGRCGFGDLSFRSATRKRMPISPPARKTVRSAPGPHGNPASLEGRFALEREIARYAAKFALSAVPRPDYWSGYRVRPLSIEFWRDRPFRLHDRTVYRREDLSRPWTVVHLYP